jgi:hypothetical protein
MPELMRGYAPADAFRERSAMKLKAGSAGRPGVSARRSGDHAEQRADRQRHTLGHPRFKGRPTPRVHPDHATAIVLSCLTRIDPGCCSSRSVSVSESASLIRNPARQSTTINPFGRLPYGAFLATRMIAMISSTGGGSAAYR